MQNTNLNELKGLGNNKFILWFLIVNLVVFLTLAILLENATWPFIVVLVGFGGSFFSLIFSKSLITKAHDITFITPDNLEDAFLCEVYQRIENLSKNAGLECVPAVGIYESPDMNAFATGSSQKNSMVAFSSALLDIMDIDEIEAVAAHEIAHIANKDMLGTTLIQGLISSIVIFVTLPIHMFRWFIALGSKGSTSEYLLEMTVYYSAKVTKFILLFLGSLCSLAFSRHREYKADHLACKIMQNESKMISALTKLKSDTQVAPITQADYAAFKISGKLSFSELFSTHPDIDKRIAALEEMKNK